MTRVTWLFIAASLVLLLAACWDSGQEPAAASGPEDTLAKPGARWTYEAFAPGNEEILEDCPGLTYEVENNYGDGRFLTKVRCLDNPAIAGFESQEIRADFSFFHAPRIGPFALLEAAPFPTAFEPGLETFSRTIRPGPGWREVAPETVHQKIDFDGHGEVIVPAGRFPRARRFIGASPGWKAEFWWADSAGFVRMIFKAEDGMVLEFRLKKLELAE